MRQEYESKVKNLPNIKDELFSAGKSEQEVAKELNNTRRNLGEEYKNETPEILREYIYYRNEIKYDGDKLGPTYEWLKGRGKTDEQIIESACRPNDNIDLVMSGFDEWYIKNYE
ncbi:hypothetical protein FACS1894132_14360 [Clostridia bacterium]|nr:hypothetical protein FACS1894132_14360 [Clostridia bacterium]